MEHGNRKKGSISKKGDKIKAIARSEYFGPVPAPEDLAKYDSLINNGAERFMTMAEKEQNHRHEINSAYLDLEKKESARIYTLTMISQIFGIIAFISLLIFSGYALYLGYTTVALSIIGIIVAVVTAFAIGKKYLEKK